MRGVATIVVKIQISLHTTESEPQVRAYTEDRTLDVTFPQSAVPGVAEALRGEPKAYFEAYLDGTGKLELLRRMPAQAW